MAVLCEMYSSKLTYSRILCSAVGLVHTFEKNVTQEHVEIDLYLLLDHVH